MYSTLTLAANEATTPADVAYSAAWSALAIERAELFGLWQALLGALDRGRAADAAAIAADLAALARAHVDAEHDQLLAWLGARLPAGDARLSQLRGTAQASGAVHAAIDELARELRHTLDPGALDRVRRSAWVLSDAFREATERRQRLFHPLLALDLAA